MNIWYFCMSPHVSLANEHRAPSIHIRAIMAGLQALGHQVRPFVYGDVLGPAEAGIRRHLRPSKRTRPLLRNARFFASELLTLWQDVVRDRRLVEPSFRDQSIDLAYERLFPGKSAVSACARDYRVPFIVESNAPAQERKSFWNTPLYPLIRGAEMKVLQRADAVILVSTPLKRYYGRGGISAEKMVVLPNAVDELQFSPDQVTRNLRQELGLEGSVVAGFVGNIHAYHGPELFLPLARSLAQTGRIRFLIVGVGEPALQELHTILEHEQLGNCFTLVGRVPNSEVPNYISAMDICVLPRFMWYGSPMKVFEYGAMGKPIVAPDLENIREVLTHGETALLFEPDNLAELTEAIQHLANHPQLRTQLGACARQHILAHHTWVKRAEQILKIHAAIVAGAQPALCA